MIFIRILILLQVFGIFGSVFASIINIESIVVTGAIFSILGLLLTVISYQILYTEGLLFGLSVPSATVFCFCLIYGLKWSPNDAAFPVASLLVVFALLSIPSGLLVFWMLPRKRGRTGRLRFQYHLSTLIILMVATAVVLSACRAFNRQGLAFSILFMYGIAVAFLIKCFYTRRRLSVESAESFMYSDTHETTDSVAHHGAE